METTSSRTLAGMLYIYLSKKNFEKLRSGFSGGRVEGLVWSQAGVRLVLRS